MTCNAQCPCHAKHTLSVKERLQIEANHFTETGEPDRPEMPSAAQGDVHWLDWHENESRKS